NGALLVEGPPAEVARDPKVKAVYLGEAADA
ncbi:MAG: Branched-chain amino acid ATP-binding cassette transporter, partial [Bradyrhizobium sp.]|nr:Branched-chain amino acid ATP-binding cassette transporter [Bradyrhizobium sp.]